MIKLCIFDLDGTVLDTIETIAYYGNYALQNNGIEPIETCEYKYLAGNGISNLIKNMLHFRKCFTEENRIIQRKWWSVRCTVKTILQAS